MSIPNDNVIQDELLKLLYNSENNVLHCNIVYDDLAKLFHELTEKEKTEKYKESKSHWANRVQFARLHLVNNELLYNANETRKLLNTDKNGYWKLTPTGINYTKSNLVKEPIINSLSAEITRMINNLETSFDFQNIFNPENLIDARERTLSSIVQRRGQTIFRQSLLNAYNSRCAISDCNVPEALEASHIIPYLGEETNKIQNGILLRADLHTLFDLRLISIDEKTYTVKISEKLENTEYQKYNGKKISLPINFEYYPSKEALNKHRNESKL